MLHEGVIYRHIVLTVPAMLRQTFYQQATAVLSPFMRCGVRCLDDVFSRVSGTKLKGGYIVVIQTHGRNGQYNPHLHIIATSGGGDRQAQQWIHLDYVPYALLRKKWQWHLLTMLRQTVKTQEMKRLVDTCSGLRTGTRGLANKGFYRPALCANTPPGGPALRANGPTLVCEGLANRRVGQR